MTAARSGQVAARLDPPTDTANRTTNSDRLKAELHTKTARHSVRVVAVNLNAFVSQRRRAEDGPPYLSETASLTPALLPTGRHVSRFQSADMSAHSQKPQRGLTHR